MMTLHSRRRIRNGGRSSVRKRVMDSGTSESAQRPDDG